MKKEILFFALIATPLYLPAKMIGVEIKNLSGTHPAAAQTEISLINRDSYPKLVQVWTESERGIADRSFTIIPSVFRLEAKQEKRLSIFYKAAPLPQEKETLYWLNIKQTPLNGKSDAEQKDNSEENSRISLIYRPLSLQLKESSPRKELLKGSVHGRVLRLENTGSSYIIFRLVAGNGKVLSDKRHLAPYSTKKFPIPAGTDINKVRWEIINNEHMRDKSIYFSF